MTVSPIIQVSRAEDSDSRKDPLPSSVDMPDVSILSDEDDLPLTQLPSPIKVNSILSTPGTPLKAMAVNSPLRTSSMSPLGNRRLNFLDPTPSTTPTKRSKFDGRSQTRISQLLQSHTNADFARKNDSLALPGSVSTSSINNYYFNESEVPDTTELIRWLKPKHINDNIYSDDFRLKYGEPTCILPFLTIAIGTTKGYVLVYDYHQNLKNVLGTNSKAVECGAITVVNVSADSTYLAAGHQSGDIFLWDFGRSKSPILHIPSISFSDRYDKLRDGHLNNVPVHQLSFIGKRHTALISADTTGLVFYHNGYRNVLGYHANTRKILGKPTTSRDTTNSTTIFACSTLPLGTSIEPTDEMGLVAVMTPNVLAIVSIIPNLVTQFKIGKPKLIQEELGLSGCLSWYPAVITKTNKSPPKLAYCWGNIMTILELDIEPAIDEANPPTLNFRKAKRWAGQESIVSINWLSNDILMLLTSSQQLVIINESNMTVCSYSDLMSKHIYHSDLFAKQLVKKSSQFYANSLRTFRRKVFLLGRYECFIGNLINWADKLLEMIKQGMYLDALDQSRKYYLGEDDLILVNLPENDDVRHKLVYGYIIEIFNASLVSVFKEDSNIDANEIEKKETYHKFLQIVFRIYLAVKEQQSDEIIEESFETFSQQGVLEIFYDVLEPLIFSGEIEALSPSILKNMVEFYTSNGKASTLEELLCLMDITTIDIDLTIQLCKKFHLRDTLVYIWNALLNDYITPLMDFVTDIKLLCTEDTDMDIDERGRLHEECLNVYSYISYILTGRQYPTEVYSIEESSKLSIYYALFNGTSISWPPKAPKVHIQDDYVNEPAFPYLFLLLKFDCLEFLSALNEAMEDPLLNDDEVSEYKPYETKVNRQYIVDILLDIFDSNEFSPRDHCHLSIFIARNYPKYAQFIRLSDSVLEDLVEKLCSYPDEDLKTDCELALQSLLSVYHSPNISFLLGSFKASGFDDVLYNIYKTEGRYSKVLETWLNKDNQETGSSVIEMCLDSTGEDRRERAAVESIISANFEILARNDTQNFVSIINRFSPQLHIQVLDIKDDYLQLTYLKELFENSSNGSYNKSLVSLYIKKLSKFDKEKLYNFINDNIRDIKASEFASIIHVLREAGAVNSVILLLESQNEYQEAFEEVTTYLKQLGDVLADSINSEVNISSVENELWKYLVLGMKICENEVTMYDLEGELYANEVMWLKLINLSVELLKQISHKITSDPTRRESYIVDLSKRLVQECFTKLIDLRSKDVDGDSKLSFLRIFSTFLNNSSAEFTTLGGVRSIIQEVFLAYTYEAEMLQIALKVLNDDIYKDMELLDDAKLKGWAIEKECAACGKRIWGKGISYEHYCAWEDRRKEILLLVLKDKTVFGGKFDKDKYGKCELVAFNCHHGYHRSCLNNLGGKLTCILCEVE